MVKAETSGDDSGGGGVGGGLSSGTNPGDQDADDTSSGPSWPDLAPQWLQDSSSVLKAFGQSPLAFILGAILQPVLAGLNQAVGGFLSSIRFVFVGSDPASTEGMLGFIDLPAVGATFLISAGDWIGSATLDGVNLTVSTLLSLALKFGPLAPVALSVELAVVGVVLFVIVRTLVRVVLDVIPGAGGLIS